MFLLLFRDSWIHCSNHRFPAIQLTVRDALCVENEEFLLNKIKPIFDLIEITHLDIRFNHVSVDMFIKILACLPNVTAIRMIDLPSHEEFQISDRYNQITRITLRNNLKMNQIDLILHLFPRLDYLSLQYISNDQIESIVHDTLLKIQKKYTLSRYDVTLSLVMMYSLSL
jgi:hypothetical protein